MLAIILLQCRQFHTLIVLGILACFTGCSSEHPPTYPVQGQVVFSDGAPLTTGGVVISELISSNGNSINARGIVLADGTFELTTFNDGDGAVAGKHRMLVRAKRGTTDYKDEDVIPKPVIAPRFESYETSELEFTVRKEPNDFTITVDRPT